MAHYKTDIIDINLNTGNIHRSFLSHAIGQKDDDADRFGIRAYRDGVPVDLSGASCHAWFTNSQGTTIALTSYGTVSGNEAYVTLPQACYDYDGQFTLAIKIVGGGVSSTVRIVDGVVDNINVGGAVTPTGAVPTYSEILSQYDAMVAATAAANTAIAEPFDAEEEYPAGKYVINDGALYLLPEGHEEDVTWANTIKTAVKIGDQTAELKEALDTTSRKKIALAFESGTITSSGNTSDSSSRIRLKSNVMIPMPKISVGDYFYVDPVFQGKVYTYSASTIRSDKYIGEAVNWTNGIIRIPDENAGQYALILLRKTNDTSADISDYVSTMDQYVKYYSYADIKIDLRDIGEQFDGNWSNLFKIRDSAFKVNGVDFTIENGVITVNGTASSAANLNLYMDDSALPAWCEPGKKYYVHYSADQKCYLRIYPYSNGSSGPILVGTLTDASFVAPETGGLLIRLSIATGVTITNLKVSPQISDTKTNQEILSMLLEGDRMLPFPADIPYTALEYHALWDDLVTAGIVTRSDPTYMSFDTSHEYPLYTYRINANQVYIAPGGTSNYDKQNTDGSSPPYTRKKILIVSGIHGSERATPVILYGLISKLWTECEYANLFTDYEWTIVPLANPWGFAHSFVKNGSIVYHGGAWYPTQDYVIEENNSTNKFNGGIRQNKDGIDINRDFSDVAYTSGGTSLGFVTEEAQYLRSVYLSDVFDLSLDMHQHYNEDDSICGYASPSQAVTGDMLTKMRMAINCAGFDTDVAARLSSNKTAYYQTSYIWNGTNNCTFNNYVAGYSHDGIGNTSHADHPVQVPAVGESGARCSYYSGVNTSFNSVANAFGMTYFWNLLQKLVNLLE